MKKIISLFLSFLFLAAVFVLPAYPAAASEATSTTVTYLEDGSYFVTELFETTTARSSTKNGTKETTYYTSSNVAIWKLVLTGTFEYDYGVSSRATNASAYVNLYTSSASVDVCNAYTAATQAYGYASVTYLGNSTYKEVKLTCDKYGNLS